MPKKRRIEGCAGTQYGCCPDGVTAKKDADGSNCSVRKVLYELDISATRNVIKNHKLYYTPLHKIGKIILSIESYKNKSIIFCKFKSNNDAKKNGFKSVEFKYTTNYNLYTHKQKNQVLDFVNRFPNLTIQPNFSRFTFVSNIFKVLSNKIVTYIAMKGITCNYYNIRINSPGDKMNYGASQTNPSSNSSSFVDWINQNWKYPVAVAMAGIGATLATWFKDALNKLGSKIIKYFSDNPEVEAAIEDVDAAVKTEVAAIEELATQELAALEDAGLAFEDTAAALETMEYDKVTKDFVMWTMGLR